MKEGYARTPTGLVCGKTFKMLSFCLLSSAIVGGLYGDRLHFHYGLSFSGALCLMLSWFDYLRLRGVRFPQIRARVSAGKVSPACMGMGGKKVKKPAFQMNPSALGDDPGSKSGAGGDNPSQVQLERAGMWSKLFCGVLLTALSCLIGT